MRLQVVAILLALAVMLAAPFEIVTAQTGEPPPSCPSGMTFVAESTFWVMSPFGECPDEGWIPRQRAHVRAQCIDRRTRGTATASGALAHCRANGTTLPTESQWEAAARAGTFGTLSALTASFEWTSSRPTRSVRWLPREHAEPGIAIARATENVRELAPEAQPLAFRCRTEPSAAR